MELITRKEAKAIGLKNYFTGEPCKYGHIDLRKVDSGQCIECKRIATRLWREKEDKDKFKNRKTAKDTPTVEYLLSFFIYNKSSGELVWKDRPESSFKSKRDCNVWRSTRKGKIAGSPNHANHYIEVRLPNGELHKAHRLIWKIETGEDPELNIDHINNDPSDNRIENLRLATPQENSRNTKTKISSNYRGVYKRKDKYFSSYTLDDKVTSSPLFDNPEEAARWYDEQVTKVFGNFAKLNFPEDTLIEQKEQ